MNKLLRDAENEHENSDDRVSFKAMSYKVLTS